MKVFAFVAVFVVGAYAMELCAKGGTCCNADNPNIQPLCNLNIEGNCCADTKQCCPNQGSLVGGGFICCDKKCVAGTIDKPQATCEDNPDPVDPVDPKPEDPKEDPKEPVVAFDKKEVNGCDPTLYDLGKAPTCCHSAGCGTEETKKNKYCCASDTGTCCNVPEANYVKTNVKDDAAKLKIWSDAAIVKETQAKIATFTAANDNAIFATIAENIPQDALVPTVFSAGYTGEVCCEGTNFCCKRQENSNYYTCCKKGQYCARAEQANLDFNRQCIGEAEEEEKKKPEQTDFHEYDFWAVLLYFALIFQNMGTIFSQGVGSMFGYGYNGYY